MDNRQDSLIESYKLEKSDTSVYKNKIVFTTVKGLGLVYYTNTESFLESLKAFDSDFVITYEFSKTHDLVDESEGTQRIIKVKLPKLPKK